MLIAISMPVPVSTSEGPGLTGARSASPGTPKVLPAAGIAGPEIFNLHHLGAEPGERFGARRPGLKLGEVHDANAFETIEFDANAHRWSLPLRRNNDGQAYHPGGLHTTPTDVRYF